MVNQNINQLDDFIRDTENIFNGTASPHLFDNGKYEFAVARFVKLKEEFIDKIMTSSTNYQFFFHFEEGKKILWDLLFLSLVVKFETPNAEMNQFIQSLDDKGTKVFFDKDFSSILLNDAHMDVDTVNGLIDMLKDAVCIFDSIRNSFAHNTNHGKCYFDKNTNKVHIENDSPLNCLSVDVDFSYIANFGNGLKPLNSHKNIAAIVDLELSKLFKGLGYNASADSSVFYRTSPRRLSFLLNLVNGDYVQLLDLPVILFSPHVEESRIQFLLGGNSSPLSMADKERLFRLPVAAFSSRCSVTRLLRLSGGNSIDIDRLCKMPDRMFLCSESGMKVFDYLVSCGFDIDQINQYPKTIFNVPGCFEKVRYFVEYGGKIDVEKLKTIPENIFIPECDLNKIKEVVIRFGSLEALSFPNMAYCLSGLDSNFSYLFHVKSNKEEFRKCVCNLPRAAFETNHSRFTYLFSHFDLDLLKQLPKAVWSKECSDERLIYLLRQCENNDKFIHLPEILFQFSYFNTLLERYVAIAGDISKVASLPRAMFNDFVSFDFIRYLFSIPELSDDETISYLLSHPENIAALQRIPSDLLTVSRRKNDRSYCADFDNMSLIFKKVNYILGPNKDVSRLFDLPENIFFDSFSYESLVFVMGKERSLSRIKEICGERYKDVFFVIGSSCCIERISKVCGDDFSLLLSYPKSLFNRCTDQQFSYLMELVGDFSLLKEIPEYALYAFDEKKIEYLIGNGKKLEYLSLVPSYAFDSSCSLERLQYIMEKIGHDYHLLYSLPKEVFFCEEGFVDFFLDTSNDLANAVKKSWLGTQDENAIALFRCLIAIYGGIDTKSLSIKTSGIDISAFDLTSSVQVNSSLFLEASQKINSLLHEDIREQSDFISRFSLTKSERFKNIQNKSLNEVINDYVEWEVEVRNYIFLEIEKICQKILSSVRNASLHYRIVPSGSQMEVQDFAVEANGGTNQQRMTFYSTIDMHDLFQYTKDVYEQFFHGRCPNASSIQKKNLKEISLLMNIVSDENDFNQAFKEYLERIEEYIEETKKNVIALCILRKKQFSNVHFYYDGIVKLIWDDQTGAHCRGSAVAVWNESPTIAQSYEMEIRRR